MMQHGHSANIVQHLVVVSLLAVVALTLTGCGRNSGSSSHSDAINVPLLHVGPKFGGMNTFFDLEIGTPPQVVSVQLDTGSGTLGVAKTSKDGGWSTAGTEPSCNGNSDGLLSGSCVVGSYDPLTSSTNSNMTALSPECNTTTDGLCGFFTGYVDGSGMEGFLVEDTVKLGKLSAKVSFGSTRTLYPVMQIAAANGIIGVSAGAKTNCLLGTRAQFTACSAGTPPPEGCETTCRPDAFTTLLKANGLKDKFGLCMGLPNSGGAPGVMTLGGSDDNYYTGTMLYTNLVQVATSMYYSVEIVGFGMNGKTLAPGGPAIVDTGNSGFQISSAAFDAINQASVTGCKTNTDCKLSLQFPEMCVHFVGMTCTKGKCVLTEEWKSNDDSTTIGFVGLSTLYVEFDRAEKKVGFAERNAVPCKNECSAYITEETCKVAECTWSDSGCSGSDPKGNSATYFSTVTSGTCLAATEGVVV